MKLSAGLLLVAWACASDVKAPLQQPEPSVPAPRTRTRTTRLTVGAPQQELEVPALAAAPATLALAIEQIDNPSLQSFSLNAAATWSGATAGPVNEDLGTVTPYPADRPGIYLLSVPAAARELLGRKSGRLRLRLSLRPITDDRPLVERFEVTLGEPVWR